jgi:putative redox protein
MVWIIFIRRREVAKMNPKIEVRVEQIGPSASEGRARSHTVTVDRPEAKGGSDRGPMGGELMLIGLGGCFMSNLLAAVRTREARVANVVVYVAATVEPNPDRITAIEMAISASYDDAEQMEKIVTIAERSCLVSNTLKQGLPISVRLKESLKPSSV